MKSKLPLIISAIVGASIGAFLCGLMLTILVIMPAREPLLERASATPEPGTEIGPRVGRTPEPPSPTPIPLVLILTPQPPGPTPSPAPPGATPTAAPSVATTPGQSPTLAPSPTPTPTATSSFPFYYVEGSRLEEVNCQSQWLQGWVQDASGTPLDGITIRWQYWNNTEFAVSGDPLNVWQPGEFKFTYFPHDPGLATDFVLQIVASVEDPEPQSEPLVIRYDGCGATGQVTSIVFRQR